MAAGATAEHRLRGFVLVLVVDQSQADGDTASIARVCRDYDVGSITELRGEVETAATQAGNQLDLAAAAAKILARAAALLP